MKSALYLILLLGSIPLCNGAAPPDGAPALPVSFRESLPVADTAFQVMKTPFRQWSGPTPSEEDDVRDEGNPLGDEIEQVQKARKTIAALKKAGKFLEKLTMGDLVTLPVGIQQEIGNITYTLGIESIRFYPEYTEADLFLEVDLPGESLDPVFGATGIKFTRKGGLTGDLKLELLGDFPIDIRKGKSRIVLEKTKGPEDTGTYAVVNCDGFRSLGVKGYVVFSRDWLIPTNAAGAPQENGRVKGHFNFQADSWDLVATLSDFTPFAVKGFEDLKWQVDGIALDFSDFRNPEDVRFPENYPSPFLTASGMSRLWKGVYIDRFSVTLPDQFKANGGPPISVEARDMIIDDLGMTGMLSAYNLLSLEEGNLNGWAFSMDTFSIRMLAMQFQELHFAGKINLPLFGADKITPEDCLGYGAMIMPGNDYRFSVNAGEDRYADLWKARISISANSTLGIQYTEGQFITSATLFGTVSIDDRFGTGIDFRLPETRFEGLRLSNQSPYFQPGNWQFPESLNARFGPFEMGLENIGLQEGEQPMTADLRVAAVIGLAADNIDVSAMGGFRIGGKLVQTEGRQRWVYESFKVDSILVAASTESWGVGGRLDFFQDDPEFGTGFYGRGELWFRSLGGSEHGLEAAVQFGTKQGSSEPFRYFFCDVMARPDISIMAGLRLKGIGGGVFHRMSRAGSLETIGTAGHCAWVPGSSISGITYMPDDLKSLGVKANIVVAATGKDVWSVNGAFEIAFYAGGGLDYVALYGNAVAFGPVNWNNSQAQASASGVTIFVNMYYHQSPGYRGFRATADVFMNLKNRFKGLSPHPLGYPNYAGGLELEFSTQTWFINIGTPDVPLAAGIKIPVLGQLAASAYLDIGNHIPAMPDPPDYIQSLTGAGNFMRNEALAATGSGFAFGASLALNTGKRKVLGAFYYELGIGLGFDIMLQNYGDAVCAESQEKIGINGWYASGQAWAFFEGEVGIDVNLGFIKGEFPILQASAAVLLQVKGPDPFWAKGYVGGKYNVLNGLVKGSFKLGVTVGSECILSAEGGDPFTGIDLINELSPGNDATGISTAIHPTVTYSFPVDQAFQLDGTMYKLTTSSRLTNSDQPVPAAFLFETGDSFAEASPDNFLPGNSSIRFEVKAWLLKKSQGCSGFCDTIKAETRSVAFSTGPAFANIPPFNIKAAYPFDGQLNFHKDEYGEGYLYLHTGQSDLFNQLPPGAVLRARFTATSGQRIERPLVYQTESRKIKFTVPAAELETGQLFKLEIVRRVEGAPQAYTASTVDSDLPGSTQEPPAETVLYTAYFRTSLYPRFEDKVAAIGDLMLNPGLSLLSVQKPLTAIFEPAEPFDQAELYGSAQQSAILELECKVQSPWFQSNGFQHLIYDYFPSGTPGYEIPNTWRDLSQGNIPVNAVAVHQRTEGLRVTGNNFLQNQAPGFGDLPDTVFYAFPNLVLTDYLHYKAAVDSLFQAWAEQSAAASGELEPESYNMLDMNADGTIPIDEWIRHFRENCTANCTDCLQTGAEFICPIPQFITNLSLAAQPTMDSVSGKTFEVAVRYRLPGTNLVTTSKTIRLIKN